MSIDYKIARSLHALAAAARIHFGGALASSELSGDPRSGRHTLSWPSCRHICEWDGESCLQRTLSSGDSAVPIDPAAPELITATSASMEEGFRLVAVKRREGSSVSVAGDTSGLLMGSGIVDAIPRRTYRSSTGIEALSVAQEWLAGTYANLPHGARTSVTRKDARILLGAPYSGGGPAPRPEDVVEAARLLAQLGVAWDEWEADLAGAPKKPTQRARSSAPSANAKLIAGLLHADIGAMKQALSDGAEIDHILSKDSLRSDFLPKSLDVHVGKTASLLALQGADLAILEWLLEHGASANQTFPWGASLLSAAISDMRVDACRLLLERGATHPERYEPLRMVQRVKSLEILKLLLDAGAPIDPTPPKPGIRSFREQLAGLARTQGDETLATRIEGMPPG